MDDDCVDLIATVSTEKSWNTRNWKERQLLDYHQIDIKTGSTLASGWILIKEKSNKNETSKRVIVLTWGPTVGRNGISTATRLTSTVAVRGCGICKHGESTRIATGTVFLFVKAVRWPLEAAVVIADDRLNPVQLLLLSFTLLISLV